MRPIKYLAFNGKELVPVISLDSMKDGEPIVLVSEDGSGDLPLKNLGKVPVYEWTGKVDKNGKEIYGGHINQDGGKVIWTYDDASFSWEYPNGDIHPFGEENDWCEVKGHIQTNPELLK